jgi:cytochrome c peroxidase
VACSTCHDPARAFTDGRPTSIVIKGGVGQRNASTILKALYSKTQFWDGRVITLEEQAALPIINPVEMGQPSIDAAVAGIAAIDEYQQAFRKVFGSPPNGLDLVGQSLPTNGRRYRSIRSSIASLRVIRMPLTIRLSAGGSFSTHRAPAINATR